MMSNSYSSRAMFHAEIEDGAICIMEADVGKEIEHDAQGVIADLARSGFDLYMPVIYRNNAGDWVQLLVDNRRFVGFRPTGETEKGAAKHSARLLLSCEQ